MHAVRAHFRAATPAGVAQKLIYSQHLSATATPRHQTHAVLSRALRAFVSDRQAGTSHTFVHRRQHGARAAVPKGKCNAQKGTPKRIAAESLRSAPPHDRSSFDRRDPGWRREFSERRREHEEYDGTEGLEQRNEAEKAVCLVAVMRMEGKEQPWKRCT